MTRTPLTVHNAEIRTAIVEVKTLTISGKQVTLAVFRQLVSEPLTDADHRPLGPMWGTVNYHPDKCADAPEHHHVVWQRGSDLRRTTVPAPHHASVSSPAAALVAEVAVRDGLQCYDDRGAVDGQGLTQVRLAHVYLEAANGGMVYTPVATFHFAGVRFRVPVSQEAVWAFKGTANSLVNPQVKAWRDRVAHMPPTGDLLHRLRPDLCHAFWTEVQALPQLFIAV